MKFSELVQNLGAINSKEIREIIVRLGIPVSENARTIPEEFVNEIIAEYKEAHAPLLRRSVSSDSTVEEVRPTKENLFALSSTTLTSSKEEEDKKKKEEAKKKREAKKKAEEEAIMSLAQKDITKSAEILNLDFSDTDEEEEHKEDDVVLEEGDTLFYEEEKIQKQLEKELRKNVKKTKHGEEEEKKLVHEEEMIEEKVLQSHVPVLKTHVTLPPVISVKEFAEKVGLKTSAVIGELLKNGVIVTINHKIDFDTAMIVADSFGVSVEKEDTEYSTADLLQGNLAKMLEGEDVSKLEVRPPIVSIMGHVDHGKTSLLDYIRHSKVTETEAGGITQQIGAYQVDINDKKITFLDTPGHEAFTAMRARGAKATDIAILVVAADEGVKPQTEEAINHAREAHIPIIVALNKMDKEGANVERVKASLAEHNLVPEDWGGDTIMVPISAKTGEGIDTLLEMILLVSEINPLQANPARAAIGTIIETHLDTSLGPIATVLINTGTLRFMDNFVVGEAYGRVKVMKNPLGKRIKEAFPSAPVQIVGFSELPQVGDILQVEKTEKLAREKATEIKNLRMNSPLRGGITFSDIIAKINHGDMKQLKVVLKADTKGSLEAVRNALLKLNTDEVQVQIIHSGIGNVTDTDVLMASASMALLLGFNIQVPAQVERTAEKMNITVKNYRVIYHLTDEIKKLLSGMLDPQMKEVSLGDFQVMQIFFSNKKFMIIGGKVQKGKLEKKALIRVVRGDKHIGEGVVDSLQKGTESVSEIGEGFECGIKFTGNCIPEPKDIFEVYKIERIERSL